MPSQHVFPGQQSSVIPNSADFSAYSPGENSCIKSVGIEGAPICRIGRLVGVVVAAVARARSRMVVPRRDQPPSLDFLSGF